MDINEVASHALLADASYADFRESMNSDGSINQAKAKNALLARLDSQSQVDELMAQWEVIHHQPDMDSGFSATLFKSTDPSATQPYVLALRGTLGSDDLIVTDISDIVHDGLAIDQIVDLKNYWSRLTTPRGQTFIGSELVTLEDETIGLALATAGQFVPGFNFSRSHAPAR